MLGENVMPEALKPLKKLGHKQQAQNPSQSLGTSNKPLTLQQASNPATSLYPLKGLAYSMTMTEVATQA